MHMESRHNELLERFWEGKTTLSEEQELRQFVHQSSHQDPELKGLFNYFDKEKEQSLGDDFDAEILAQITSKEESGTPVITMNQRFWQWSRVAAAIVAIVAAGFFYQQQQQQYVAENTFESPEMAYKALKEQLLMVSHYMNKGNETIEQLNHLNKAQEGLKPLRQMQKAGASMVVLSEMNLNNN